MATNLRLVYDSQRSVCTPAIAGLVLRHFGDAPHLAELLTQCMGAVDAKSSADEIPLCTYDAVLLHVRGELTEQFGRRLCVGGVWRSVLRDVDPARAGYVLRQFGLHTEFARERFATAVTERNVGRIFPIFARIAERLRSHLVVTSNMLEYRRDRTHLEYVTFVACMASSPSRPAVLVDEAHRLGALVDKLLAPVAVASAPAPAPPPTLHVAPRASHLRLVDND